ncbi:unnamed protein product [Protopolystoma xenopodis]|uniref:Uncharacterized protein n=1 Tax=Protopolystoma xenopodis TaxID=117903 RepID=A0A3S5BA44_9PLAT|nr:unnamed protein product [Protopolystoma xenopodis]
MDVPNQISRAEPRHCFQVSSRSISRSRSFSQSCINPRLKTKQLSSKPFTGGVTAITAIAATAAAKAAAAATVVSKAKFRTSSSSTSSSSSDSSSSLNGDPDMSLMGPRVFQRRGGGEVQPPGAPGGPRGLGPQPLVQKANLTGGNISKMRGNVNAQRLHNRNIGWRLGRRKELNERRRRISDYSLSFALFGLAVMILETEMTMNSIYGKI